MPQPEIKIRYRDSQCFIEIKGNIDEDFVNLSLDFLNAKEVIVDFNGIIKIQSTGIREWLNIISPYQDVFFIYRNCPKIVIDLINMIEGFLPANGTVESFYVPYFHVDTGEERKILFTYGSEFNRSGINPPSEVLTSTGELMEMDVVESKYFKFLKYIK
jgi:hypothetical protein